MLVGVGVQVAGGQRGVGLDVVGEFDDLHLHAVFFQQLLDLFHDLGVRTGGHAHLDLVFGHGGSTGQAGGQAQACDELNQLTTLHDFPFEL